MIFAAAKDSALSRAAPRANDGLAVQTAAEHRFSSGAKLRLLMADCSAWHFMTP
jgi:hypothetical protein